MRFRSRSRALLIEARLGSEVSDGTGAAGYMIWDTSTEDERVRTKGKNKRHSIARLNMNSDLEVHTMKDPGISVRVGPLPQTSIFPRVWAEMG